MKDGVIRKGTAVALAAVLLLMALFPVPTGVKAFDEFRYRQAHANPAVLVVLGTAAAAAGFAVGGATLATYDANLQAVYDGFSNATSYWSSSWSSYVQEKGSFDAALNSAVTIDGQNIDLQTLTDAGFFDSLHNYSVYLVDNGDAAIGDSSLAGAVNLLHLGNYDFQLASAPNSDFLTATETVRSQSLPSGYYPVGQNITVRTNGWNYYEVYYSNQNPSLTLTGNRCLVTYGKVVSVSIKRETGQVSSPSVGTGTNVTVWSYGNPDSSANYVTYGYLFEGVEYTSSSAITTGMDFGGIVGAVSSGLYDGTAAAPTSTVQPFEPTAAQLEAGYSSADILEAINSGNVTTSGILEYLQQYLPSLAGLAATVSAINTQVGTLTTQQEGFYETVIDGVQAIPGAVSDGADVIVGGLEGVLEGVGALEGVMEGVLDGVQAIPASIADVIDAIQTGVVDLTGALESALHPQLPNFSGSGGGNFTVPTIQDWMQQLGEKAPFAYMFAFTDAMNTASESYSNVAKFRIRHTFEIMGNQVEYDINAEPWLNSDLGGVTIAQLLRASVTLTLCMGILYASYRTALAAVKG